MEKRVSSKGKQKGEKNRRVKRGEREREQIKIINGREDKETNRGKEEKGRLTLVGVRERA